VVDLTEPSELLTCLHAEIGPVLTAKTVDAFARASLRSMAEHACWKAEACSSLIEFLRANEGQLSSSITMEDAIASLCGQCGLEGKKL
jgi:hypothetical protein